LTTALAGAGTWSIAPGREVALDKPLVLAIINATPDSFSDGGEHLAIDDALRFARRALQDGAWALDVGGESTRPGAQPVEEAEQIRRVVPIIRGIRDLGIGAPISVDTTSASVARAALDAGADIINDISAGRDDAGMLPLAAERRCGLILMHRLRAPAVDSYSDRYSSPPEYNDGAGGVVGVVKAFLAQRLEIAQRAGVDPSALVLDPGLGFGKTVEQNFELIRRSRELLELGRPLLSGASRKSFVGKASGVGEPRDRVAGSVVISVAHLLSGVRLFRVHDVRAHAQALRVAFRLSPGA